MLGWFAYAQTPAKRTQKKQWFAQCDGFASDQQWTPMALFRLVPGFLWKPIQSVGNFLQDKERPRPKTYTGGLAFWVLPENWIHARMFSFHTPLCKCCLLLYLLLPFIQSQPGPLPCQVLYQGPQWSKTLSPTSRVNEDMRTHAGHVVGCFWPKHPVWLLLPWLWDRSGNDGTSPIQHT